MSEQDAASEPGKPESTNPTKVTMASTPDKVNYICTKCRFNFSIKQDTPRAKKCPYCGEGDVMVVKKYKDVDDLIQEAADSKYDY